MIQNSFKTRLLLLLALCMLVVDRMINLSYFGWVYTDVDEVVMWNGLFNYASGSFHEPFFYGQPYNYMLEAFVSVPFYNMGVSLDVILPIVTSVISLLPFLTLALLFYRKGWYLMACLSLLFPVLLPADYGFLTSLSRGFVQAHFFIPFLMFPLFYPYKSKNIPLLFIASSMAFIANQSAIILILPIILYVSSFHYRKISFYLYSLLVIPFLIVDYYAKYFYETHPERVVHSMTGMELNFDTFLKSMSSAEHFRYLFPLNPNWGILYLFVLLGLIIISLIKNNIKALIFIVSSIVLILITFSIPKVQLLYPNGGGIFFTPSRLYLMLPFITIISLSLICRAWKHKTIYLNVLIGLAFTFFVFKNYSIQKQSEKAVQASAFGIGKNKNIKTRIYELEKLSQKHNIDLIVNSTSNKWSYFFDGYTYNPLTKNKKVVSIMAKGDRRTWLYDQVDSSKTILLNGMSPDTAQLQNLNHEILKNHQILIKNNRQKVKNLFEDLKLEYGAMPL